MLTIDDALKYLPTREGYQIKRAFAATGSLDRYDGVLSNYLAAIAIALEVKNKQLADADAKFKKIIQTIEYEGE